MSENLREFLSSLQNPDQAQTAVSSSDDQDAPQDLDDKSQSAQSWDVERELKAAGLWEKVNDVQDIMEQLGILDTNVAIVLTVDKNLSVTYQVTTDPKHKAEGTLRARVTQKFGASMTAALKKAKLKVTDTVSVKWMANVKLSRGTSADADPDQGDGDAPQAVAQSEAGDQAEAQSDDV